MVWSGWARTGKPGFGAARILIHPWRGVARPAEVWRGLVWRGKLGSGVERSAAVRNGSQGLGMMGYGAAGFGKVLF